MKKNSFPIKLLLYKDALKIKELKPLLINGLKAFRELDLCLNWLLLTIFFWLNFYCKLLYCIYIYFFCCKKFVLRRWFWNEKFFKYVIDLISLFLIFDNYLFFGLSSLLLILKLYYGSKIYNTKADNFSYFLQLRYFNPWLSCIRRP